MPGSPPPNQGTESTRAYQSAPKKAAKNITSEKINQPMPQRKDLSTCVLYRPASLSLITVRNQPNTMTININKPANIPVLVDAAAEDLTIPCIHLERGADVVAYSGGKAICGPQGAGLLLGSKKILMAAWQASSPHHGPSRDNKVGREDMGVLEDLQEALGSVLYRPGPLSGREDQVQAIGLWVLDRLEL